MQESSHSHDMIDMLGWLSIPQYWLVLCILYKSKQSPSEHGLA